MLTPARAGEDLQGLEDAPPGGKPVEQADQVGDREEDEGGHGARGPVRIAGESSKIDVAPQ